MAYSKELHSEALDIIKRRRTDAEYKAQQRKNELNTKYPEFRFIDNELAKTGLEVVTLFSSGGDTKSKLIQIREKNTGLRKERKMLLKSLGLPEDYLEVKYTCEKCSDTGFIEERDEVKGVSYGTKFCSCHLELLKKLAIEQMATTTPLELSSFEDFNLNYYPKASSRGISSYNTMKGIYEDCVAYSQNFRMGSPSLYFYGRTGLGKTHLSFAIANEVIRKGYNVVYGSIINFFNTIEKEKFGRAEDRDTENLLIQADLLILDDLGAEFTTALTTSVLYNIINSRIARGVPTIISSNLDLAELRDRYPESVASRIIGNYSAVHFEGDDVRQIMNEE